MERPDLPPLPPRIRALPLDPERGYPVPWFVQWFERDNPDKPTDFGVGRPDYRVVDSRKIAMAVRQRRCWVCGGILGRYKAFTIGPMCALNRVSSEPPSHQDCAIFSAQNCPFLSRPHMRRRENDMPEGVRDPAGIGLQRNPGVTLVWTTTSYEVAPVDQETRGGITSQAGYLFSIGDPSGELYWFAEGRQATQDEIMHSIDTGLPLLREAAEQDHDREEALRQLEDRYRVVKEMIAAAV